jgi:hypothetical protein
MSLSAPTLKHSELGEAKGDLKAALLTLMHKRWHDMCGQCGVRCCAVPHAWMAQSCNQVPYMQAILSGDISTLRTAVVRIRVYHRIPGIRLEAHKACSSILSKGDQMSTTCRQLSTDYEGQGHGDLCYK